MQVPLQQLSGQSSNDPIRLPSHISMASQHTPPMSVQVAWSSGMICSSSKQSLVQHQPLPSGAMNPCPSTHPFSHSFVPGIMSSQFASGGIGGSSNMHVPLQHVPGQSLKSPKSPPSHSSFASQHIPPASLHVAGIGGSCGSSGMHGFTDMQVHVAVLSLFFWQLNVSLKGVPLLHPSSQLPPGDLTFLRHSWDA